jgi:hypothetical protein
MIEDAGPGLMRKANTMFAERTAKALNMGGS